jgi:Uncharacterized protein conserved in bacteria (DUF2242)
MQSVVRSGLLALGFAALALLAACAGAPGTSSKTASRVYLNEAFASTETFSRVFTSGVASTCEAARRALLSQGYVITSAARADAVNGRKSFQPEAEVHVQIEFHIVCVPEVTAASAAASDPPSSMRCRTATRSRRTPTPPAWG